MLSCCLQSADQRDLAVCHWLLLSCRLCDELQPLLGSCTCEQLLTSCKVLAQLGCLRANSPKQQQLVDQLQQQLTARRLQLAVWQALPELVSSLQDLSGQQHQAGLSSLVKGLTAVQASQGQALQKALQEDPLAVLKLAAGLQEQGKFEGQVLEQLQGQLPAVIQQLCAAPEGTGDAAAAAAGEGGGVLSQQLQDALGELSLSDVAAVLQLVIQQHPKPEAATTAAAEEGSAVVSAGAAVVLLLQALLDSEVLLHKPLPPSVAAAAQQEQEQQPAAPPPPPPAAAAGGAGAAPPPPPPPPASADTSSTAGDAADAADAAAAAAPAMVPVVFGEADWQALAQLLHACVHWHAPGELPHQLVQLVVEVSYALETLLYLQNRLAPVCCLRLLCPLAIACTLLQLVLKWEQAGGM
jgi:hypothetical protein